MQVSIDKHCIVIYSVVTPSVNPEKIGKELDDEGNVDSHDASTNGLINAFKENLSPADYLP